MKTLLFGMVFIAVECAIMHPSDAALFTAINSWAVCAVIVDTIRSKK